MNNADLEHLGDDDGRAAVVFPACASSSPRPRSLSSPERQQLVPAAQQAAAC